MSECWIISVPGGNSTQQKWQELQAATMGAGLSKNSKFTIPELKVGTLDALIGLSDDLGKVDQFADNVCHKLASYMGDVLEQHKEKVEANLKVGDVSYLGYVRDFQWNMARYPTKQSLRNITESISKTLTQAESDLSKKSKEYNNLKTNLENMERKATGSLLMRNLAQVVKKDDVILNSEYLQTLLVAVPIGLVDDWEKNYETLTDYVVPKSARLIDKDEEYGLWGVTLFKKVVEEFKYKCTRHKFFVRDFTFNEEDMNSDQNQLRTLSNDKKKMLGPLLRWLKINFSESFMAWMHIKALRVFVESVLRYGLPVNFQAAVIEPQKKGRSRLRDVLNNLYKDLDSSGLAANIEDEAMPGLALGLQDYYPYVDFKLSLDFST